MRSYRVRVAYPVPKRDDTPDVMEYNTEVARNFADGAIVYNPEIIPVDELNSRGACDVIRPQKFAYGHATSLLTDLFVVYDHDRYDHFFVALTAYNDEIETWLGNPANANMEAKFILIQAVQNRTYLLDETHVVHGEMWKKPSPPATLLQYPVKLWELPF